MSRLHGGWFALVMVAGMVVRLFSQAPPAFEVASVKRAEPGKTGAWVRFLPGGRFVGENVALEFVLQRVYGVRDFQIIAAPALRAIIKDGYGARYEIEGKGREDSTPEQLTEMVKTLLAERFQLRVHKETRDLPVYALVPASGGVKGARAADGKPPGGIAMMASGWIHGERTAIPHLAETLSRFVDRPVLDKTNLDQLLDFDLTWTPLENAAAGEPTPGCPPSFQEMAKRLGSRFKLSDSGCPSLFTAVREQMGLRLEPQLGPVDVLVIDAVQFPTDN